MSQRIIINIAAGGETEIKVEGCAGPGCQQLTEAVEKALGTVKSDQKTAEYHRKTVQAQKAEAT